jgi:protein TonB
MNRNQKKCLAQSTLIHALVLGGVFSSIVIQPSPEPPKPMPLQLASASRVEAILAAQSKQADPIEPLPEPEPPAQEKVVQPEPKPEPKPKQQAKPKVEQPKVKQETKPKPKAEPKPKPKPEKKVIKPNLERVTRSNPLTAVKTEKPITPKPDPSAQFQNTVQQKLNSIRQNLSATSTIQAPSNVGSPVDSERYARWVRESYENAWNRPDAAQRDNSTVKVRVLVKRDGSIISANIISKSGDPLLDQSIQRALDLVKKLPRFPDGIQESQMEFTINFNLKSR